MLLFANNSPLSSTAPKSLIRELYIAIFSGCSSDNALYFDIPLSTKVCALSLIRIGLLLPTASLRSISSKAFLLSIFFFVIFDRCVLRSFCKELLYFKKVFSIVVCIVGVELDKSNLLYVFSISFSALVIAVSAS